MKLVLATIKDIYIYIYIATRKKERKKILVLAIKDIYIYTLLQERKKENIVAKIQTTLIYVKAIYPPPKFVSKVE